MYVEQPRAKLDIQTSGSGTGKWNREHIFPQSRGGFANGTDDIPDGVNIFLPTNANDLLAGHSDAHHLRAEDATENSSRGNKDYGGTDYNGPAGTQNSWRGDVSRALMYMTVRYNGLFLLPGNLDDTTTYYMGDLDSLLSWHKSDPPDDFEMYRNNYIYDTWQKNRNPFIDKPEIADYIWGSKAGMVYNGNVGLADVRVLNFTLYPNPIQNTFTIAGLQGYATVKMYNIFGKEVFSVDFQNQVTVTKALPAGVYVCKIFNNGKVGVKQLVVN